MTLSISRKNKDSGSPITIGGSSLTEQLFVLLSGTFFGIVLVKSELASWFRIQQMFRLEDPHMFLVLTSATIVGAVSLLLLKKLQVKAVGGETLRLEPKKFQKGVVIGGLIFGMGWAISTCPGPIYAQIGNGDYIALVTLAAAVAGMYLYAYLQPKLPH